MFATTTLWFTEKFFVPNSSVVVEIAVEVIAPVETPITAVLMYRARSVLLRSKKNAHDVGAITATIVAGLEILCFPLKFKLLFISI